MTQAFIGELEHIAGTTDRQRLSQLADVAKRPVRVAVVGRAGVGRGCVEAALRQRGAVIASCGADGAGVDVCIRVIAETVKAEDLAVARPALIVLTKADLAGVGPGGPVALARSRAVAIERRTGVPTVPVVGLLAALADDLEPKLVAALRRFVTEPPNLSDVDAFVDDPHPVDQEIRRLLLARLDRFGIAHAVLALAKGCEPDRLVSHLARVGNADEVESALAAVAASVQYRRLRAVINELLCASVQFDDQRLAELLTGDVTAMALMTAAVDVVETAGSSVDRTDTAAAHLERAVHWRRYGRGPVTALHRRCSADIVRGSLRLLDDVRTPVG